MVNPAPAPPPRRVPDPEALRLRQLLDLLPVAAFEMDLTGRLLYANRATLTTFGYTPEELAQGRSITEGLSTEDRARGMEKLKRRVAGEALASTEYTCVRRDGSTFPALVHTEVVRRDGNVTSLNGYVVDLSEPKKAERALRYRVEFERLIMGLSTELIGLTHDALDVGIVKALGSIGRFMGVDRAYVFRLSPDGATVDNTHEWIDVGVPSDLEGLQHVPVSRLPWFDRELRRLRVLAIPQVETLPAEAAAERALWEGGGVRSVMAVAMMNGEAPVGFLGLDSQRGVRFWSEDEAALLRVVGELFVGALLRRDAEAALRESEAKYRALVETTDTGFVLVDEGGRVCDANPEYVRMSGHRTLDEILGRPVIEWTAPKDRERNAREVALCFERGAVRNLQVEYQGPSGARVPVEINATVFEAGGRRLIFSLARDVAERKRLQDELLKSEKLHSLGVLAGGIAHDFNNFLTAVLGNLSLLQMGPHPPGQVEELLGETAQATLRARDLTRQLLTFSRGGAPVRKVVRLQATVRETTSLALRGRATCARLELPDDLHAVEADEGQIGQVVGNLVLNASQAMAGGGAVAVEAANRPLPAGNRLALPAGPYVALTVSDRGSGINPEHLHHIFEPYFTTKQEGSGLGLAVCYSIVANHGGAIEVDSTPGEGSTVTVWLPAAAGAPAPASAPSAPLSGQGRILVMDDEDAVRATAVALVRSLGYEAQGVREGQEAVEAWRAARARGEPFHAAIMDLTVRGGLGGREALRELLAIDPSARVIVSSGYNQDPVMARHKEHGFCDALAKPYSVAELSGALARAVAGSAPPRRSP